MVWAARDDGVLLGFCGLKPGAPGTPIDGEVEIGWRFGHACWGQGYAREAAAASLAHDLDAVGAMSEAPTG